MSLDKVGKSSDPSHFCLYCLLPIGENSDHFLLCDHLPMWAKKKRKGELTYNTLPTPGSLLYRLLAFTAYSACAVVQEFESPSFLRDLRRDKSDST